MNKPPNQPPGISYLERRAILQAQPLLRMQQFAELLGWRGLCLESHLIDAADFAAQGQDAAPFLIVYFTTTEKNFHLQINPNPQGQTIDYTASVLATRFGLPLTAVGWHPFRLSDRDEELRQTAERLTPFLARRNFKDRNWRKQLLASEPAGKCDGMG
jgi:hypothetical protein